jgi:4-amino-4-deoxy-L-arabinose transferase-like glycosyltransferase
MVNHPLYMDRRFRPLAVMTALREGVPKTGARRWCIGMLTGITLVAFALRFYRIDFQSVWHDELFALGVSRLPFAEMHRVLIEDLVHPPLHYYLLHGWFQIFGYGPLQARMLSLIFGVLAVLMLYVLARYLFGLTTALLSAFLLAVSQVTIMYSQEARPYAMCLLIVLGCGYWFLRAVREKSVSLWIAFVLFAGLLLYTHYYGFFVLGAMVVFGAIYWRRYRISRRWIVTGVLGMAVCYTPWLASGLLSEAMHGQKFHLAHASPGAAKPVSAEHWYTPVTILNTFNNGRPSGVLESSPWWTFLVGGMLFTVPAVASLKCWIKRRTNEPAGQIERENVTYLVLLTAVPIVVGLVIAHFTGVYAIRYIAFCAAPYYILVARAISSIRHRLLRWAFALCILLYSGNAVQANYSVPYKEDYKNALASIAGDYQPGDCAVVAQLWEEREARWAWAIYGGNRQGSEIRSLQSALSAENRCERVWLISVFHRGNPVAVRNGEAARQKLRQVFELRKTKRFFWIIVDLYGRGWQQVGSIEERNRKPM